MISNSLFVLLMGLLGFIFAGAVLHPTKARALPARLHAGQRPTAPMGGEFTPTRGRRLPLIIKDIWP